MANLRALTDSYRTWRADRAWWDGDIDDPFEIRPVQQEVPVNRRLGVRVGAVAATAAVALTGLAVLSSNAGADPSANAWARLRNCESSGNYAINTGNGYYGAYQFNLATWRSVGGSGYPNQASHTEQDARALILYRERGWQPWTCATILGLKEDSDARSGRISDISVTTGSSSGTSSSRTPTAPAWPGPWNFTYGDTNPTIARFQLQMRARGVSFAGTGVYGAQTKAVILRLQSLNGLPATGTLGPNTWRLAWTGKYSAAPAAASKTAPAWPGPVYYSLGDTSTTIKRFQLQMKARGVSFVGTGQYGAQTLAVIKRLQSLNGLAPNGLLGPNTWKLAWTGKY